MALDKISQVSGTGVYIPGDDIDTDRIIPARYLRAVTFDDMGEHLFRDVRYDGERLTGEHPIDWPQHQGASVMISGSNFGCGSSREHAPQAIYRAGFRAVIAESFAEIFFGNSTTLGMPCVSASGSDIEALAAAIKQNPDLAVDIDLEALTVTAGELQFPVTLEHSARSGLLEGRWDPIADLLESAPAVSEKAAALPYMQKA